MARSDPQINFRLPSELRDRLQAAMAESGNSLTAEIVQRLEESFDARDRAVSMSLQIQGAIALNESSLKLVTDSVDELIAQRESGRAWEPLAHQAPSLEEEIERGQKAKAFFAHDLDLKRILLTEIGQAHAAGKPMSATQIRKRIQELGITVI